MSHHRYDHFLPETAKALRSYDRHKGWLHKLFRDRPFIRGLKSQARIRPTPQEILRYCLATQMPDMQRSAFKVFKIALLESFIISFADPSDFEFTHTTYVTINGVFIPTLVCGVDSMSYEKFCLLTNFLQLIDFDKTTQHMSTVAQNNRQAIIPEHLHALNALLLDDSVLVERIVSSIKDLIQAGYTFSLIDMTEIFLGGIFKQPQISVERFYSNNNLLQIFLKLVVSEQYHHFIASDNPYIKNVQRKNLLYLLEYVLAHVDNDENEDSAVSDNEQKLAIFQSLLDVISVNIPPSHRTVVIPSLANLQDRIQYNQLVSQIEKLRLPILLERKAELEDLFPFSLLDRVFFDDYFNPIAYVSPNVLPTIRHSMLASNLDNRFLPTISQLLKDPRRPQYGHDFYPIDLAYKLLALNRFDRVTLQFLSSIPIAGCLGWFGRVSEFLSPALLDMLFSLKDHPDFNSLVTRTLCILLIYKLENPQINPDDAYLTVWSVLNSQTTDLLQRALRGELFFSEGRCTLPTELTNTAINTTIRQQHFSCSQTVVHFWAEQKAAIRTMEAMVETDNHVSSVQLPILVLGGFILEDAQLNTTRAHHDFMAEEQERKMPFSPASP